MVPEVRYRTPVARRPERVEHDLGDVRLGSDLARARCAAPAGASAIGSPLACDRGSRSCRRTRSCRTPAGRRRHAVGAGRGAVRVQPARSAAAEREDGARTCPGRAASGTAPLRQAAKGFAPASPATPMSRSHGGVVRLEVVVADRPVARRRRPRRGPGRSRSVEVLLSEARQLAVGVEAATADGGRQVVHLADEQSLAVLRSAPVGARLEQRIGAEEVAPDRARPRRWRGAATGRTADRGPAGGCGPSRA